jgi:hypothetical protein
MPEDSTRRLLRVFGVAMTECEDQLAALTAALAEPAPGAPSAALEAYGRAARELQGRFIEVSRLVLEYQLRAQEAMAAHLAGRRAGA